MIRRPTRSTQSRSSAASDVYKRQEKESADAWATIGQGHGVPLAIGTQLRTEFEEALKHGYIVQRTRATNPAGTS